MNGRTNTGGQRKTRRPRRRFLTEVKYRKDTNGTNYFHATTPPPPDCLLPATVYLGRAVREDLARQCDLLLTHGAGTGGIITGLRRNRAPGRYKGDVRKYNPARRGFDRYPLNAVINGEDLTLTLFAPK